LESLKLTKNISFVENKKETLHKARLTALHAICRRILRTSFIQCFQKYPYGNPAQSPPDGFARNLRADFPSYCPEIPCHTAVCLRNF